MTFILDLEVRGIEPLSELYPTKNLYRRSFRKNRKRLCSIGVAIRIEQSESPSSVYNTGDLPYERQKADVRDPEGSGKTRRYATASAGCVRKALNKFALI